MTVGVPKLVTSLLDVKLAVTPDVLNSHPVGACITNCVKFVLKSALPVPDVSLITIFPNTVYEGEVAFFALSADILGKVTGALFDPVPTVMPPSVNVHSATEPISP